VKPFLRIARPHNGHFLALEDLFLLMEQVNTKSQAPGRINDGNVNHTPTRKTGVSPTLDLRHTFLYLTPIRDSKTAEIPRPNVRGAGFLPFRAVQDRPTSRVAAT